MNAQRGNGRIRCFLLAVAIVAAMPVLHAVSMIPAKVAASVADAERSAAR